MPQEIAQAVNALLEPLHHAAHEGYIGEGVSQQAHALQCAFHAQKNNAPAEVVLAALFHDVGHLVDKNAPQMDGLGVVDHEKIGGAFLRQHGCSPRMATLVASHVEAKRYLCHRKPDYSKRLSEASLGTLAWQGGPMSEASALAFETAPDFKFYLALRSWDELAKDPHAQVPPLSAYQAMLEEHLHRQTTQSDQEELPC